MTAPSARGRAVSFGWSVLVHLLLLMLLVFRFDRVTEVRPPAQPEIIEAHVVESVPVKSRTRPPRSIPALPEATPREEPATAAGPEDAGGQAVRPVEVTPEETAPSIPDPAEKAAASRRNEEARQQARAQERNEEAQRRRRELEHEAARDAARAQAELQARAAKEQAERARAERLRKAEHEAAAQAEREEQAAKAARRKAEAESRAHAEAVQKAERTAREKAARESAAKSEREAAARAQSEREAGERAALAARAKEEAELRDKAAAELAARRQAERDAKEQAERAAARAKAEAAAKAAAEKAAKEQAAQARAEAELQQRLEKDAQELAAAVERRERQERERALREQLAQEAEGGDEARIDDAAQQWAISKIKPRIKARWVRPPSAGRGMSCKMRVSTDAGGQVTGVVLGSCSGDAAFARSAEAAVMKASPLPMPPDPRVSARLRSFQITFQPE